MLFDSNKIWTTSKDGLKKVVENYFEQMFTDDGSFSLPRNWPKLFPTLIREDLQNINAPITLEETKAALFSIGKLKAPEPDGMLAIFYQSYWNSCSHDIFKLVNTSFNSGTIPPGLNDTFIALVPKIANPTAMTHIRPISLCNTIYKVISKTLVARIRSLLNQIINPAQSSFIPGRQISDNIVIV